MRRFRLFALSLVCLALTTAPSSAQLFEVAAPFFSRSVADDGNYTPIGPAADGIISRASLKHGELYFSFTVVGGESTIKHLRDKKALEIDVVILGDQSQIISGLGINQQKWKDHQDAWISQFNNNGYFTFRTYMTTKDTARELMELQIRDEKRNVVRPIASSSSYKASIAIIP